MKDRRKLPSGHLASLAPNKREEGVLDASGNRTETALYDFSSDGGAVGTLTFGRNIPANAIVTEVYTDEITNITSGGLATITIKAGSTTLVASQAFSALSGIQKQTLNGGAAGIKPTVDSELQIAIGVAALTAGKLRIYVKYMLANDGHS